MWARWKNVGILYVNDLLHDFQPRFLSHTEMEQKFGINISFLELLQIRSAIPCLWKRKLINAAQQELICKPSFYTKEGDNMIIIGKSSKSIYYALIKLTSSVVTSQLRWNDIFPINEVDQQALWSAIYTAPYKTARDTKLQAFQFRIIHRFLPCNKFLKNIRIRREDTCLFCQEADTIEHFLYNCHIVKAFWRQVIAWFDREVDIHLNISLRSFLFGIPDTAPNARIINFVILFAKFFIYRQKLFHQGSLDLVHFLREFRTRLQVEKYLTTLENKRHHFQKWKRTYAALG